MIFKDTFIDKKTGKQFTVEIQLDQIEIAKIMAQRAIDSQAGLSVSLNGNIRCRVIKKL
jgi:hypothetical protein